MHVRLLALGGLLLLAARPMAAEPLVLFGAGSLREVLSGIAAEWSRGAGIPVETAFAYSGRMRERIEAGERADLFASADMGHPERLRASGHARRVVMFVRNTLCVVAPARVGLTQANLLDRMLDPALTLGVFPAIQDPVGDYTVAMFARAEALRPGAEAALKAKARILSDALLSAPPATGEDIATAALRQGRMDIHVSYCSTVHQRLAPALPGLAVVPPPAELTVGPEYGLAILRDARPGTEDLALAILSPEGQARLAAVGFTPIGLPAKDAGRQ